MKALWLLAAVVVVWALPISGQAQEQNANEEEEEDRYVRCSLSGDPELSTFFNQRGTVPFPCFSHMADMRLEFNENSSAVAMGYDYFVVEVYASAGIQPYTGRYFVEEVTITIAGYAYISGTDIVRLIDEGTFKTNSSNVETFLNSGQTPEDEANVWNINSTFPDGVVRTGYDEAEKWAFLKLLRKNNAPLEIGFRPRDKSQGIPQHPRPGLYIEVRKGRLKVRAEAKFPETLCSTKNDERTFRLIKNLPRYEDRMDNNRELMLYTAYSQTLDRDVVQTEPKCVDTVNAFRGCTGEEKRLQAISLCSPLTTAKKVRCLEKMAPGQGKPLEAFTKCINVCCDIDKATSQAWLEYHNGTCPIL